MCEFHVYFSSKKEKKEYKTPYPLRKKKKNRNNRNKYISIGMSVSCKQSTNFMHYNKRMFHIWETFGVNPSNTPELTTYKQNRHPHINLKNYVLCHNSVTYNNLPKHKLFLSLHANCINVKTHLPPLRHLAQHIPTEKKFTYS